MIYFTGDIHGSPWGIKKFCAKVKPTSEDIIVLLRDVGANYYKVVFDRICDEIFGDG